MQRLTLDRLYMSSRVQPDWALPSSLASGALLSKNWSYLFSNSPLAFNRHQDVCVCYTMASIKLPRPLASFTCRWPKRIEIRLPMSKLTPTHGLSNFLFFCAAPVDPGGHTRRTDLVFNRLCNGLQGEVATEKATERTAMPRTTPPLLTVS